MKDFFISYNKADLSWAEWAAWQLEEKNYTVVMQAWDFRPGSNFVLEMQKAASECERTIAILSPDYLNALYTQPEWAAAFAQDPTGAKGTLLPVRVRECEIKGLLAPIIYVDLFNLEEAAARKALLDGVKRERVKPATQPGFPGKPRRSVPQKPRFPGSMPSIWNVPHPHNPNFTGREDLLNELKTSLNSSGAAAITQAQAIYGLGGIGKTQLAVEYAYLHISEYEIVWWIRSEEAVTLASDYADLAAKLDLAEKEASDQRIIIEAVKQWLRQHRDWLLIFDNAPDAASVRDYIPGGAAGHVIVTFRSSSWKGIAHPLGVRVMALEDAIEFILKRTGQTDKASAKLLSEALGCLPLALEQAGAYIDASGCALSQYLKMFQANQQRVLEQGERPADYPDTLLSAWNISFKQVDKESKAAADLMKLCAFFAPENIPLQIIREGTKHLPEPLAAAAADELSLNNALAVLRKYSFIERDDDTISIHRLVQAVTSFQMNENTKQGWVESAVRIVNSAFPYASDDVRTWDECSRLLPHALTVASFAEAANLAPNEAGRLLNQAGLYLKGRAEFDQAKVLSKRALAISEAAFGPDHPDVAIDINNLGSVLKSLGDLEGAKANFERALAISEAAFGPDHPDVATSLNNLGSVLKSLGDLEGAKANFERALVIDEAAFGPDHPNVAIRLNNLGSVLESLGDLKGAKANYERALVIDEAAFGPDHPNVATSLNNLGSVLKSLGDLKGAKANYERALQIFRHFLGENHPSTITVRGNLRILEAQINDANRK